MVVAIRKRNFRLDHDKQHGTFDKSADGLGWGPEYVAKSEGVVVNRIRYAKNFQLMKKICLKCDRFTDSKGTVGEHCNLASNEGCDK